MRIMKTMIFENFDAFCECEHKQDYELVAIVKNPKYGTICADLMTDCKRWKTAVNRFFNAIEKTEFAEHFSGWKDGIIESIENGCWNDREAYWNESTGRCEYYPGGYHWCVEDCDGSFYIELTA